ncbi:MAG: enoyl-CoA hydratase [Gemmatimonadota bacterium]|nr:enoyl-CoA hydratase [Gemmatimonadota bacterium]
MSSKPQIVIEKSGPVGRLVLNRPDKLNSFSGVMRDEIATGLESLAADANVRVVIVTGRGRAFCAGADVQYMADLLEAGAYAEADALVEAGRRVITAIVEMRKPVIAALNGPAAGGGANLALACDLRIASDRASIGQTFNRIGLHPDWGGTWIVPRLVGPAKAAELFFLAEMIDAREAERIGLVNRVVPHEELEASADEWAHRLADKPALSLALAKQSIRRSFDSTLDEMLDFESDAQNRCFRSPDALEGTRAFVEKRPPNFTRSKDAGA